MKISETESLKAAAGGCVTGSEQAKILPADRPKGLVSARAKTSRFATPLERGMSVAEAALSKVPEVRDELVEDIKTKIKSGQYKVSADEVAEMMLRRLAADRVR